LEVKKKVGGHDSKAIIARVIENPAVRA